MKRLKKNHHILQVLRSSSKKLRNSILQNCHDDTIKTIAEIAINILNGNNKISKNHYAILKKNKKHLRDLACSKKNLKYKRKLIIQKGGFLPTLIGTVLTGIIGKLISAAAQ